MLARNGQTGNGGAAARVEDHARRGRGMLTHRMVVWHGAGMRIRHIRRSCLLLLCLAAMSAGEVTGVQRMLVVGDSISQHGPRESLGWAGNWGMAASSIDKDWVHLLHARIVAARGGAAVDLRIDAEGGGKTSDKLKRLATLAGGAADLVLVQLGENDNTPELIAAFERDYTALLAGLRAGHPSARILCFGVWTSANGTSPRDAQIRTACAAHGAEFVSLAQANAVRENRAEADARWTHKGVNWHPGDRGMQAYADAAWAVLTHQAKPEAVAALDAAASAVGIVLAEDFSDPAAAAKAWRGQGAADDGGWRIALPTAGSSNVTTALPAERLAGRKVRLSARIRSDGVSSRPKPYNGIKVMLITVNAEGEKWYPQAPTVDGTQPWTMVEKTVLIPSNVVKADLVIGLEAVSGSAWFDDVRVEIVAE